MTQSFRNSTSSGVNLSYQLLSTISFFDAFSYFRFMFAIFRGRCVPKLKTRTVSIINASIFLSLLIRPVIFASFFVHSLENNVQKSSSITSGLKEGSLSLVLLVFCFLVLDFFILDFLMFLMIFSLCIFLIH